MACAGKIGIELQHGHKVVKDIFIDKLAGFGNDFFEVEGIDGTANEKDFDIGALLSMGEGTGEVHFFYFAQVFDYLVNNLVDAQVLAHKALYVGKERVAGIGGKEFAVAFGVGGKESGCFEAVKLKADGVCRFAEFSFEAAQVGFCTAVQEEFEQEFDAGFGSDEAF